MKKFIKNLSSINKLYEVDDYGALCYQIVHTKSGAASTFEHDPSIVERLENYIREHGRSLCRNAHGNLCFPKSTDGTPQTTLAAFLSHCYFGIPLDIVRTAKVQHIGPTYLPDGSEDCRKSNLVHMSGVQLRTASREFRPVKIGGIEYVELRMRACTRPAYLTNDPTLINLLADTTLFNNFRFNGRSGIQAELRGATREAPYIHQIACAVKKGLLTRENFDNLDSILRQMTRGGTLEVDHFFADVFNNTYQNLSLMSAAANSEKSGYTAADFGKYRTAWAHDWDTDYYLVEVAAVDGDVSRYYRCSGEAELLSCLRNLTGRDKMTNKLTHFVTPGIDAPTAVPLPGYAFTDEKKLYKAAGGTGKFPKVEASTAETVERGAALLAIYKSEPGRFAPWPDTKKGFSLDDAGITAMLAMFGAKIATD